MRLRHVNIRELSLKDNYRDSDSAISLEASHNLKVEEDHYECLTEILIEQNEELILKADFLSSLQKDDGDSDSEEWLHQTSMEQIYPHIRAMIVSIMASAMITPLLIPIQAPKLEKNSNK